MYPIWANPNLRRIVPRDPEELLAGMSDEERADLELRASAAGGYMAAQMKPMHAANKK